MPQKPLVILIHGLHQRGFIMYPIARYLNKLGYPTHQHDYRSLTNPIKQHSERLNHWLEQNHDQDQPIHLVGHSLGGLVIRDFVNRYPQWQIARCVTLGTPHLGSISADYVKKLISPLVGKAYEGALDGSIAALPDRISLGVIAGSSPYGLGQALLSYHKYRKKLSGAAGIHDGTVYVNETRLPNATDHIVMPVSHTGMLMNKDVAKQAVYFLEHGRFDRGTQDEEQQ